MADSGPVLSVHGLNVYYGSSHALQGVDIALDQGVHAVLGRNGMGKTTLCNAIMGLVPVQSGSIRFDGRDITGLAPNRIASMGIGYTPQGRRLWPSLSVDEHLRLCAKAKSAWSVERIYETFPRLAERRNNGGGQLSGGEQQMLAIARALLPGPRLLVMDEPTEGLAPVIVDQVVELLCQLEAEREVSVLLIEQNLAVATSCAEDVSIMVNGQIKHVLGTAELAADRQLQERLLGVGRHSHDGDNGSSETSQITRQQSPSRKTPAVSEASNSVPEARAVPLNDYTPPPRWSADTWKDQEAPVKHSPNSNGQIPEAAKTAPKPTSLGDVIIVAGTFDTKAPELNFLRERLLAQRLPVRTVDLSTSGKPSSADIPPHHVAAFHPHGAAGVFTGDRGTAVAAMADAFEAWARSAQGIRGMISAAGSGGTSLVTPAMRAMAVGVPKMMISTVASGDVGQYVGPSDIMMMYSVTDVQGINRISAQVLANGANALAGAVNYARSSPLEIENSKPPIGLTMFGVTTQCVQSIVLDLEDSYECLVFHATGTGGQSMEKLADSGMLTGVLDITTTEVCDMMMGGVMPATEDRFGAIIRSRIPYVGSVGALDMVNWHGRGTVPDKYRDRLFYEHNPQVTLMRTTVEENRKMGRWIAERLNQMTGPVRFLLPLKGVSALDAAGQPFDDASARQALFDAIRGTFVSASNRKLIEIDNNINDPEFKRAAVAAFAEIAEGRTAPNAKI
ncbi:ABC transporter permease [Roseibium sp.]|uniref:ABC transporter permease n=1 Tax=Roseibium sp. TaxID=1936156 RepID=UPI003B515F92